MNLHTLNTPSYDYERIIQDIAFHKPKSLKSKSIQGIYYKNDPAMSIKLLNGEEILIRIWEKHMSESEENRNLSESDNIFVSAYLINTRWEKNHLPLFDWFQSNDYSGIWAKILTT